MRHPELRLAAAVVALQTAIVNNDPGLAVRLAAKAETLIASMDADTRRLAGVIADAAIQEAGYF